MPLWPGMKQLQDREDVVGKSGFLVFMEVKYLNISIFQCNKKESSFYMELSESYAAKK